LSAIVLTSVCCCCSCTVRVSLIVLVSIPTTLLATFSIMRVLGFSLNFIQHAGAHSDDRHPGRRLDRDPGKHVRHLSRGESPKAPRSAAELKSAWLP
jgi:hypothetical protein